jgi:hypothetical protein
MCLSKVLTGGNYANGGHQYDQEVYDVFIKMNLAGFSMDIHTVTVSVLYECRYRFYWLAPIQQQIYKIDS